MTPIEKEITRARVSEVKRAIRDMTNNAWMLDKAFRERLCSCHSLRAKEQEIEAQIAEAHRQHVAPLNDEIRKVRDERYRVDSEEHPGIGKVVEEATPWLRLWLFDSLLYSRTDAIEGGFQVVAGRYAEAWISGWRPSLKGSREK